MHTDNLRPRSDILRPALMLAVCVLLLFRENLTGAEVTVPVGAARLTLPVPDGYELLPLDKPDVANAVEQIAPTAGTSNSRLAFLVFSADFQAERGDTDARSIDFQTMRKCFTTNLSSDYFEVEKRNLKAQSATILDKAKSRVEALSNKGTYGTQPELENIVLPVFMETERAIGISTLWKITSTDESGNRQTSESVVTFCMLLLKGKALFFYVRGARTELEWSQAEARKLAEQLIALNPSSWVEAQNEKTGLDTQKAIDAGVKSSKLPTTWAELWFYVGAIALVLAWAFLKKRAKTEPPVIRR